MPEPITRRGREMRVRLVAAATVVFGERGYQATRVSDITTAAGTALGNFYRHFVDKNDVLLAVLAEPLEELLNGTAPLESERRRPTEAQLIAWNTSYFEVYARNRRLYRILREAAAAGADTGFAELWKAQRQRFHVRVHGWLNPGQEADPGSRLRIEAMVAMLEQLSYVHLGLATQEPNSELISELGATVGSLWHRCLRAAPTRDRATT
jgi:AcrR family transcriptional regulator